MEVGVGARPGVKGEWWGGTFGLPKARLGPLKSAGELKSSLAALLAGPKAA